MMNQAELYERLGRHASWLRSDDGGERLVIRSEDLQQANLADANASLAVLDDVNLAGASLRGTHLAHAMLSCVDLSGADLSGASFVHASFGNVNLEGARLSWTSHDLLGEVLWQAACANVDKEQLAAFVMRRRDWCWSSWCKFDHPLRNWALEILASRVRSTDQSDLGSAPLGLCRIKDGMSVEESLVSPDGWVGGGS